MLVKLKNVLKTIQQGLDFKDKLSIFLFYGFKKAGLSKLPFNTKIKNNVGIFLCEKNPECLIHSVEDYEIEVQKELNLKKGIFMDVGANIGRLSVQVAKNSKKVKVIAIEPERYNFSVILKNIEANKLKNIFPLNLGCSEKKGTSPFFVIGKGSGGNSLIFQKGKKQKRIKIKTNTLDNLSKELKLKRMDLLKIDVEGAEIKVLKGAKKCLELYHPKILFESSTSKRLKEIENFLKNFGYKINKIDEFNNYLAI